MSRVSKKLVSSLANIDGAILMVNAIDPQMETVKYLLEAIEDLPHFIILNKVDAVTVTKAQALRDKIKGIVVETSLIERRGLSGVKSELEHLPDGNIAILGIFNSGKTSLINELTASHYKVDDIPGTTLELTPVVYGDKTLIDTVGDIWDVSKPLMISVDLTGCETLEEKLRKCLEEDLAGLSLSIDSALSTLKEAAELILNRVSKGNKIIVTGAGASALVAMEMAGQGTETGLPIMVFTNNFAQAQPISFAKGFAEDEAGLSEYFALAVESGDVVIGVSASGGTGFVFNLLELAREKGAYTIAITENADTPLGKAADIIIKSEAKPEGPSSSKIQIAHLAIGHALILSVADMRGIDAHKSIKYMLPIKLRNKMMGIK